MSKPQLCLISVMILFMVARDSTGRNDDKQEHRAKQLFTRIRFTNSICAGTDQRNGTCYTQQECGQRNGNSAGTCALGFGVCCTFSLGCGSVTSENCTYFQSTAPMPGKCEATVCKTDSNICQLRLDFQNFVITGPSTSTTTVAKILNGVVSDSATKSVSLASRCLTDSFTVTNPGGCVTPTICGTNSGEHMYVDAAPGCNVLGFNLGTSGMGATIGARAWTIKVTQYSCDYENLAPEGCTQYFFGNTVDQIKTFNFEGGYHLANQNQNICIRRERNICRICYTTASPTDFVLSGKTAAASGYTGGSVCCGYGKDGKATSGYDCVVIKGAEKVTLPNMMLAAHRFCGRSAGLVTANGATAATICSTSTPFRIGFMSDGFEFAGAAISEAAKADKGFMLTFLQMPC